MPRHHPPEVRAEALRRLAANGCNYADVSEAMGLSPVTLRSWVKRYGLPKPQAQQAPPEEPTAPPPPPPAPSLSGRPPAAGGVFSLVELTRTEYLRHTVNEVDSIVQGLLSEERPTWTAFTALLRLRSDLHQEHVDVVRSEGNQLDLSADPTAIARNIESLQQLLRVLSTVLDGEGDE